MQGEEAIANGEEAFPVRLPLPGAGAPGRKAAIPVRKNE
jgi:hypothetical protein